MASVKLNADALKDLERIDPIIVKRIIAKAMWLGENVVNIVPEPLHHGLRGLYKLRIGNYRAVYSMNDDAIFIEAVGHRRDVYK